MVTTGKRVDIDVRSFADGLRQERPGFWVTQHASHVSFPEDGHGNTWRLEADSWWFRHRGCALDLICRRYPPPGPVFDIGAGNGAMTEALCRAGVPAVAVEPGRQGAQNALARGLSPVLCASLETAGFKEGSVPAFGCFDVLEHIEDDASFLIRLRTLLAPHGLLYLTVPAFQWLWSGADVRAGHFRRYTLKSLRRVLEKAGFEIVFDSYLYWFLPPFVFAFRAIPDRLMKQSRRRHGHHRNPGGLGAWFLRMSVGAELRRLDHGRIPMGSSCLAVASPSRSEHGGSAS